MPAPRNDQRAEEMERLYRSGYSLAQVAKAFGVTRQSVYKMLNRRGAILRGKEPLPFIEFKGQRYTLHRGYYRKTLGDKKRLHVAVWEDAHGAIPPGYHIHHKNGDCTDNRVENLELISPVDHGVHHARTNTGFIETQFKASKAVGDAPSIAVAMRKSGATFRAIGEALGMSTTCASHLVYRTIKRAGL